MSTMKAFMVIILASSIYFVSCANKTTPTSNSSTPGEHGTTNQIRVIGTLLDKNGAPVAKKSLYIARVDFEEDQTVTLPLINVEGKFANPKGDSDEMGKFLIEVDPQEVNTTRWLLEKRPKDKSTLKMLADKMFTIATEIGGSVPSLSVVGNNGEPIAFKLDDGSKEIDLGNIVFSGVKLKKGKLLGK